MAGEYLPFDIGRMVVAPGRRPYTFKVVFRHEALYEKGILEQISRCFESHGASILILQSSALPSGKSWIYVAADTPDSEAEEIASCLSKVNYSEEVEYSPPLVDGVGVDAWGFPPIMGGARILAFRKPIFDEFLRRGWRLLGGGFGVVLYHTFFKAGREVFETVYSKMIGDPETRVKLAEVVFRITGYGVTRVEELTGERAVVRVYDNLECESLRGVVGAESSIVRGLLAGFVAGLWGLGINDVTARETKCIRRGDPYCEIIVEKRSQRTA